MKRRFLRIDHRSAIDAAQERQRDLIARLSRGVERELEISRERIGRSAMALDLLDPRHVLLRGYAAVSVDSGGPVTSAVGARTSENLTLTFQDGRVSVTVDDYQLGQLRERR